MLINPIVIHCKTPTEIFPINIHENETILGLKQKEKNFHMLQQLLTYQDQVLYDEKRLNDYKIGNNSFIKLNFEELSSCFIGTTLITMGDGSQKMIRGNHQNL